jgi:carbon-monoxide dehydrogenase medium subunit
MKLGLASPEALIDLNRIEGLEYIKAEDEWIRIGAMTRHAAIASSSLLAEKAPLMVEAAYQIGDPQVRNMGTIGGSLAHADPAGDWGSVIIAFRGYIQVTGLDGERLVEVDKFFVDSFTPRLEPGELVTEVRIPTPPKRSGGAYIKLERRLGDFAIAGVAVQLTLDERDRIKSVGIGLTSLGPTNLRAVKAEEILTGQIPTDEVVEEAAKAAAAEAKPSTDPIRGSEAYKRAMAAVLTRRAIKAAVSRARGGA